MEGLILINTRSSSIEDVLKVVLNTFSLRTQCKILDCGSMPIQLELLISQLSTESLEKVHYSQCFDLLGIDQAVMEYQSAQDCTIVMANMKHCLERDKVHTFTQSHKIFNEVMINLRKIRSLQNIDVVLIECDDRPSVLDYYVDERCQIRGGKMVLL